MRAITRGFLLLALLTTFSDALFSRVQRRLKTLARARYHPYRGNVDPIVDHDHEPHDYEPRILDTANIIEDYIKVLPTGMWRSPHGLELMLEVKRRQDDENRLSIVIYQRSIEYMQAKHLGREHGKPNRINVILGIENGVMGLDNRFYELDSSYKMLTIDYGSPRVNSFKNLEAIPEVPTSDDVSGYRVISKGSVDLRRYGGPVETLIVRVTRLGLNRASVALRVNLSNQN